MAASMERLYEFVITVLSVKNKLSAELISHGWKQISKQSERQLGAFIYLYLVEFKQIPPTLPQASIESGTK